MPSSELVSTNGESFRRHRHDVLNALQLVRGYVQMGQTDKAIGVVDRTAAWLQSLSRWHVNGQADAEQLMWTASVCSNIILDDFVCLDVEYADLAPLTSWLLSTQTQLATEGYRMHIRIELRERTEIGCDMPLEVVQQWQDTYQSLHFITYRG